MIKKPKFTIIVPIYNCEKYLSRCIESILNQDYKNFELILINDGSRDNSDSICKNFEKQDSRVLYIYKKNSGVSKTRNLGLEKANGNYILFVDSDDYVENNYLSSINLLLEKYKNIKMINFGFLSEVVDDENNILSQDMINVEDMFLDNNSLINSKLVYLWDKHMLYNIWNKVYLKEIIDSNNLKFPDYNFGEDMEFNKKYLDCIDVLYNSSQCFYHYIKERKGSLTTSYKKDLFEIRIKEYKEFNKYFKKQGLKYEEYIEFSSRRFIERVLGCVENICGSNLDKKQKKEEIKKITLNSVVQETVKIAKPNSKKIKIMLIPIKMKSYRLLYFMGNMINKVRKKFPALFNKLKNKR